MAAQAHGLATPGGVVSETGVAGLTLSGGLGWLRRKHGLSCDALRAATVVTADGRVVRASADEHADLFWGLRGGGGNFGVVTQFELEASRWALPSPRPSPSGRSAEAAAVLREFRALAPTLPDEVSPVAVLSPVPDDEAFPASIRGGDGLFILAMAATPVEEGAVLVRPIAALGGGATIDIGGPTPYVEFQQFFDAEYPAHTMRYYWKSSFADDLADELIDHLVEAFGAGRPTIPRSTSGPTAARSHACRTKTARSGSAPRRGSSAPSRTGSRRPTTRRTSAGRGTSSPPSGAAPTSTSPACSRRATSRLVPATEGRSTGSPRSSGPGIRTTCSASTPTSRRRARETG